MRTCRIQVCVVSLDGLWLRQQKRRRFTGFGFGHKAMRDAAKVEGIEGGTRNSDVTDSLVLYPSAECYPKKCRPMYDLKYIHT